MDAEKRTMMRRSWAGDGASLDRWAILDSRGSHNLGSGTFNGTFRLLKWVFLLLTDYLCRNRVVRLRFKRGI